MTNETTAARVTRILVDCLGVDPARVTPDAHIIDNLGADSLDTYEIVMTAEEEFGIELADSVVEDIATVADFVAVIDKATAQ